VSEVRRGRGRPAARLRWVAESPDGRTEQVLPPTTPRPREAVAPPAPRPVPRPDSDDSCPRCHGTRVVEEPPDVAPALLDGMLFDPLGAVVDGLIGGRGKPRYRCLDCGCEWTLEPE